MDASMSYVCMNACMQPQDEVIDRCHRSINREFAKLKAAAEARAADRPGAPRSVVTADLWDWVEEQAGATLDADDVNAVLDRSEGAADDEDVSIAQFTHVVVRMFEQFFRVLDKQGCGYLTQVRSTAHRCRVIRPDLMYLSTAQVVLYFSRSQECYFNNGW